MDFPSFPTLFQIARNEALVRNASLTQDAIDREGSDANILIASAAAAADEVIGQLTNVAAGLFLDSASGDALDRLLWDRYGLTRKEAASAQGSVVFSLHPAAVLPFTVPANTQLSTASGLRFATVQASSFLAGATSTVANIRSLLAGADQQAAVGTITSINGQIPGAPVGLTVTNTVATAGAADRESDTSFRERGRVFYTTVRRGTLAAIEQGALAVPGVVTATAFETLDHEGRAAREVNLAIADQYTDTLADLSVTPPVYATQSGLLAQQVFNALEEYRPAGVFVNVQVAQVNLQTVLLALSFESGTDVDQVSNEARAAVVNYINNLSPGDDVVPQDMLQVLKRVPGLVIVDTDPPSAVILSPISTVVMNPLQVARTTFALVRTYSSNPGTPIGTFTL